jgi:hypothetical protein
MEEKNIIRILSELKENALLELIKKRYPNIKKIEDEFSTIDCYDASTDIYYELKCRYEHYNELLIEKQKYLALLEQRESYYVCSTPKGIWMLQIQSIEEPVWFDKELIHSTYFNKPEIVVKEIGYISTKKGLELTQLLF